jgi:hypothetical protein
MTPSELVSRVTAAIALAALLLALPAAWLAGITGALGVLAGAALAALNFRGLARRTVASLVPGVSAARASAAATLGLGLALAGPAVAVVTGVVHPVGLVVGLTLLPCAVVVLGLRAIREES